MDQSVQVAVTRVLEGEEQCALDAALGGRAQRARPPGDAYPAVRCDQSAGSDPDTRALFLHLEGFARAGAGLEVAHESIVDDGPGAHQEAQGVVRGRLERRCARQRAADAAITRRARDADQRAPLDARALEGQDRPHEERHAGNRAEWIVAGQDDGVTDRGAGHHPGTRQGPR
jgi:hypothetical protein